ncbi:MAG: Gfo/Idh/MocA family oxidoreductase [Lentisphaeria bacterium]|nr:Gfo/Idh/MocA family oxidoreductase [Lentisphaeria bacterium]
MSDHLILVGAGYMAQEYTNVLLGTGKTFTVVGRGEESAAKFEAATGIRPVTGGLDGYLAKNPAPEYAVVAVSVEMLQKTVCSLLIGGCRHILVEKPGALYPAELQEIKTLADRSGAEVFIAYNRRFYAGVKAAEKLIAEDGGIRSINFEFTEWAHKIAPLKRAPGVKEHLILSNSSHVIDLAFFLGGLPTQWSAYTSGSLPWHPSASVFSGAGITEKGILFSYHADWESAGRWSVEVLTEKRKLIFCPMEKLQQTLRGTVSVEDVPADYEIDTKYKAGLFAEIDAFLNGVDRSRLCTLHKQIECLPFYNRIANYE